MDVISEAAYRKEIGKTAGHSYLFFGEEDYLKSFAIRKTRDAVCKEPELAVFNDITIDAADYTPEVLADAISAIPMMAEEKLIVVRGPDFSRMRPGEAEALIGVLGEAAEYPYNTVILAVPSGQIDEGYLPKRPSPILKKLSAVATPVRFDSPTGAKLNAWVGKHFAHFGIQIPPENCALLVEVAGRSMYTLANEIEKLAFFEKEAGRTAVTAEDIHAVASPENACDAFALSNAILAGRYADALDALSVLKFQRVEPTIILSELAKTLCDMRCVKVLLDAGRASPEIASALKLHEYKTKLLIGAVGRTNVKRLTGAIALCGEADISLKRTAGDYSPIEKLICGL